ncbi:MAG TPA: hypothetical protein VNB24_09860 [Acidimicrobiales bacterium]|nr:hypothetical protein [Acidimicrobiales bacterium]
MINDATKFSIGLAAFGLLAAVAYGIGGGDDVGVVLLVALAIVASIVAFGAGQVLGSDPAPFAAPDAEPTSTALDPADVPRGSLMPALVAVGVALACAGAAIGSELVVEGTVLAAIGLGGWLAGAWRTHPAFDRRDAANLDDRLLGPVALPVVAFIITAFVAVSFSRVLLAVSATASWVIALVVAAAVLGVLWMLAERRPNPRVGTAIAAAGIVATLAAGGAGASAGQREFHPHASGDKGTLKLVAKDIEFDDDAVRLPADSDVEITLVNLDVGVNHNVAVYTAEEPGTPIFNGPPILSGDIVYKLRTPPPGSFRYVCDFHPNMVGRLEIIKDASEPKIDSSEENAH